MKRLTWLEDQVPEFKGRGVFYGTRKIYVEFEPAYRETPRSVCPVAWFMTRYPSGLTKTYVGIVAFASAGHPMAERVAERVAANAGSTSCPEICVPKTHRLYKAFRSVLGGLPPEPFLDMLVEEFPQFEPVTSRFLETE